MLHKNMVLTNILILILMMFSADKTYASSNKMGIMRTISATTISPDENIYITLKIDFQEMPGSAQGVFISDNIPTSLMGSMSDIAVKWNTKNFEDSISFEYGSAGEIYEGTTPVRCIFETPPDFTEDFPLNSGDSLIISYSISIPSGTEDSTEFFFPNASCVAAIDSSGHYLYDFVYEDFPNPGFMVLNPDGIGYKETFRADDFHLAQNYPNPFNPVTTITFNLKKKAHTSLKVFNLLGQEVAVLVNKELHSGVHQANWLARDMPSGIYIYQLSVDDLIFSKKMMLVK